MTRSLVLDNEAASPESARVHFAAKLSLEADVADVHADLQAGVTGLVVVDGRSAEAYAREHIPGAISLPYRLMDASTTSGLDRSKVYVTYCDGLGCNASTKAALKLAALVFKVKEMPGGMEWWKREGHAVETGKGQPVESPGAPIACGC